MFDIEQSIPDWRRQMRAAGVKNPNVLDELESHLREDVARRIQAGATAELAFAAAAGQIGPAGPLRREFAKIGGSRRALLRKLKDIFAPSLAPFPALGAFTPAARQALAAARAEAPRLRHNFIGTEHVLLGLLALEGGVVANGLKKMGVDHESLRKQVEQWVAIFPSQKMKAHLSYTPRARKALRLAAREADAGQAPGGVGVEHIFLGLLLEGDGVAGRVLKNLGLDIPTTRREMLGETGRGPPGA